ncbi:MAG: ABC transporter ATP-binding protein [Bacteroidales bacterium]|nr:ABC transporter ATP-binding protein [Bacteroidales bacterium]
MTITLNGIGKKFNTEWIFRNLTHRFETGGRTVITGRNGSGKSTLLQVIAGNIHHTEGSIEYNHNGKTIPDTEIFRSLSLVAPYQELIEEFTLKEMLEFHFSFKPIIDGFTIPAIIDLLSFTQAKTKPILNYSSGMKQRVKLVCALLSNTPLLFLDEPTTNLDTAGIDFYLQLIDTHARDRTILVCSNMQLMESGFCESEIRIEEFK